MARVRKPRPDHHLTITVDPAPGKLAKLLGPDLQKEFGDYRPAWRELIPLWRQGLQDNLHSKGRTLGSSWKPLDPDTIRIRKKDGAGTQPHVATGRMLSRVRSRLGFSKKRMTIGPKEAYPYILHFGVKSRGIAPRRFIAVSPQMRRDGERVIERFISQRLAALADRIDALTGTV